jgi:hypothetical protein
MSGKRIAIRICIGVIGLAAMIAAVFFPLLFFANEYNEMQSAKQYGGHVSVPGAIGGILTVLLFAGFLGVIAYVFIRYSIRGEKSKAN